MNLSGSLPIAALPVKVLARLQDRTLWQALLPHCKEVVETGPGQMTAKISFMAGPVPVRTDARITITETGPRARQIRIEGGSFVTGHGQLQLDLTATREGDGTDLRYSGTLTTSGLLKRLASGKEDRLGQKAEALFLRFKQRVERPGAQRRIA